MNFEGIFVSSISVQDHASVSALDGAALGAVITAAGMLDWCGDQVEMVSPCSREDNNG